MYRLYVRILLFAIPICLIAGCGESAKSKKQREIEKLAAAFQLDKTIGDYAEVFSSNAVLVEGYGIVAGLNGNGSSEAPSHVREYLIKFIQRKLNTENRRTALEFLKSRDNAVVRVYGIIPEGSHRGSKFDVAVEALEGTQTTSLEGGILYDCDLVVYTRLGVDGARTMARAKGPIYIENINGGTSNKTKGIIIGGGVSLETATMTVALFEPNYMLTSLIRNTINQRFDEKTAIAKNAGLTLINPPDEYRDDQAKLATLIKNIFLAQNNVSEKERMHALTTELTKPTSTTNTELALEAIGRPTLIELRKHINSPDEYTRLKVARVMLNLEDEQAIETLKAIAEDKNSRYRLAAIEAMATIPKKKAAYALNQFLSDSNTDIRLAAYRILKRLDAASIRNDMVAQEFFVDSIFTDGPPLVYVQRQTEPGIVIFGRNVRALDNTFIVSKDSQITLSASGDNEISLMRKHPQKAGIVGPLKTSLSLESIIRGLGENPSSTGFTFRQGLGVSFSSIVSVLEKMCLSGAVEAEFVAEPLKEIDKEIMGSI